MRRVKDFTDEQEKENLESESEKKGWKLKEVQYYFDGKHLVFDDGRPEMSLQEQVDELRDTLKAIQPAIPELRKRVITLESHVPKGNERTL